jgi:hypothetical protein
MGDDRDVDGGRLAVGSYVAIVRAELQTWDVAIVQVRDAGTAPVASETPRRDASTGTARQATVALDALAGLLDEGGLDAGWLSGIVVDADEGLAHAVRTTSVERYPDVPSISELPRPTVTATGHPGTVETPAPPDDAPSAPATSSTQSTAPSISSAPSNASDPPLRNAPSVQRPVATPDRRRVSGSGLTAGAAIVALMVGVVVVSSGDARDDDDLTAGPSNDSVASSESTAAPTSLLVTTIERRPTGTLPGVGSDAFDGPGTRRLVVYGKGGVDSMILADTAVVDSGSVREARSLDSFVPADWLSDNPTGVALVDYPCRGSSNTDDLSIARMHRSPDGNERVGVEILRYPTIGIATLRRVAVTGGTSSCEDQRDAARSSRIVPEVDESGVVVERKIVRLRTVRADPATPKVEVIAQFRQRACLVTIWFRAAVTDTPRGVEMRKHLELLSEIELKAVAGVAATSTMCEPTSPS